MTTGGRRQFDIGPIVQRYERNMALVALADFLMLGHEKVGSFAIASSKTSIFGVAMGAWLDQIASVFNRHAIPRLLALNGYRLDALPELQHGDIEIPEPMEIAEAVAKFTGSGMYDERVALEEEQRKEREEAQRAAMEEFRRAGSAPVSSEDEMPDDQTA
jgi:hypothetical protein